MSKQVKAHFISERDMDRKGIEWVAGLLFFEVLTVTLINNMIEYANVVEFMANDVLRSGARLERILADYSTLRNAATYINTVNPEDITSKGHRAIAERMNFNAREFISFMRKLRSNNAPNSVVNSYLRKLAKQLAITDVSLKTMITLVVNFNTATPAVQLRILSRMRTFAATSFRNTTSHKIIDTTYNFTQELYKNSGENIGRAGSKRKFGVEPETLASGIALGLIAYGTKKISGKLVDWITGRKEEKSWAAKIAGKAEHKGFDDSFRK